MHNVNVTQCVKDITVLVVLCRAVSQSVKHNLLTAFRHLLRPLARIAIRNGVAFPQLAEVMEDAFVTAATVELRASNRRVTADAISIMTEIDTSRVTAVVDSPTEVKINEAEQRLNSAARVLVGWHTDRDYVGPYGLVRDLEFSSTDIPTKKEISGFSELAGEYCPGIAPIVLLDELIRTGCVLDLGNGFYRALTRSYVPEQLSAESLRRFAQVVHNVIETLEVNLKRSVRGTGRIERTIFADYGLPKNEMAAFDKYIRERGQLFADDVDNWLSDRSREGQANAVQTGVGFYHYVVNNEDERDLGKALQLEGKGDDN